MTSLHPVEVLSQTDFALLSFSSSVRSSVFTRSYLMEPGWMASIRSRTGRLLLMDRS